MITLLDRFTYVGGNGDGMYTPWVSFPEEYKNAEVWLDAKTVETGTLSVDLESSADTTANTTPMSGQAVSTVGISVVAVTSSLGPLIRLKLSSSATTRVTLSVWVVPKMD